MFLGQGDAAELLEQGRQRHLRIAEKAAGEFGVEQTSGNQAQFAQAGEVLARRVDDPLLVSEHLGESGQLWQGNGIDEVNSRALASKLQQIGALGVAVATSSLGINGNGTGARGKGRHRRREGGRGIDDRRYAVAGFAELGKRLGLGGGDGNWIVDYLVSQFVRGGIA